MLILEHFGILWARLLKSWGGFGGQFGDCLVIFIGNSESYQM